jgi:hypothetical protein
LGILMACSCRGRKDVKWVWTAPDGSQVTYKTEIEAKAKVLRKGGSYERVTV